MEDDRLGLQTLLDLDGERFVLESGYWTKFEVRLVEANQNVPHGIKYSLTLHDRTGERVLGYDNAHAVRPQGNRYAARRLRWDHRHQGPKVTAYEFSSAGQLLEDFWLDVERVLNA